MPMISAMGVAPHMVNAARTGGRVMSSRIRLDLLQGSVARVRYETTSSRGKVLPSSRIRKLHGKQI